MLLFQYAIISVPPPSAPHPISLPPAAAWHVDNYLAGGKLYNCAFSALPFSFYPLQLVGVLTKYLSGEGCAIPTQSQCHRPGPTPPFLPAAEWRVDNYLSGEGCRPHAVSVSPPWPHTPFPPCSRLAC